MEVVEARTLGHGWLDVSRRILDDGVDATYDGHLTKERMRQLTAVSA